VTSQNLWSRYDRHFVSITRRVVWSKNAKICGVIHIKLNQLVYENVHKAYLSDVTVTNISESFTHKMGLNGGENQVR